MILEEVTVNIFEIEESLDKICKFLECLSFEMSNQSMHCPESQAEVKQAIKHLENAKKLFVRGKKKLEKLLKRMEKGE